MRTHVKLSLDFLLRVALSLLVMGLGMIVSCNKAPTDPSVNALSSPFLGDPGVRVTQTNDAGMITWLPSGVDIAYASLALRGGDLSGVLKSVNIGSHSVRTLDGTNQWFTWFDAEGDSLFYCVDRTSTGSGL